MRTFIRKYRGPDDPAPFMKTINRLSFGCWNMKGAGGIQRLSYHGPDGDVVVTRVGELDLELVDTKGRGGGLFVILAADAGHTFFIAVVGGKLQEVETGKDVVYHAEDETEEAGGPVDRCLGMFGLGNRNFNADPDTAAEWHDIPIVVKGFELTPGIGVRQYYDIGCPLSFEDESLINYSLSPYTYSQTLSHHLKYIDQTKSIYRPYYTGMGEGLSFMSDFERLPYGKKPFTRDENGAVLTAREVVVPGEGRGSLWPLRQFWPFVPYLFDIPYFNIQMFNDGIFEVDVSSAIYCDNIRFSYDLVNLFYENLRIVPLPDVDPGTYLAGQSADETPHYVWVDGVPSRVGGSLCNVWRVIAGGERAWKSTLSKSETIGTIGNKKDINVYTAIAIAGTRLNSSESLVEKVTNFPQDYYLWWSGTGEENTWLIGEYLDNSHGTVESNDIYESSISLVIELRVGSVIPIETGGGTLSYSYGATTAIDHVSQIKYVVETDEECAIGYTSVNMPAGSSQTFTAIGVPSALWSLEGPGTLSPTFGPTTIYTAPASNPGCSIAPVIILSRAVWPSECDNEDAIIEACAGVVLHVVNSSLAGQDAYHVYEKEECSYHGMSTCYGYPEWPWDPEAPPEGYPQYRYWVSAYHYDCVGDLIYACAAGSGAYECPGCFGARAPDGCYLGGQPGEYWVLLGHEDVRTAVAIANGCCPQSPY